MTALTPRPGIMKIAPYVPGKDTVDGRATTFLNFGGSYSFSPGFKLLFSAGHSVSGETHAIAYVGLWRAL